MDVTYIPFTLRSRSALKSFVTTFEQDNSGHITSVIYIHKWHGIIASAANMFFCAPNWNSTFAFFMNKPANLKRPGVGRNFMAHVPACRCGDNLMEDVRPHKGIPRLDFWRYTSSSRLCRVTFIKKFIGVMPVTLCFTGGSWSWLCVGRETFAMYAWIATTHCGYLYSGDCLPYAGNYLEFDEPMTEVFPNRVIHWTVIMSSG